jgi:hypothetical protein
MDAFLVGGCGEWLVFSRFASMHTHTNDPPHYSLARSQVRIMDTPSDLLNGSELFFLFPPHHRFHFSYYCVLTYFFQLLLLLLSTYYLKKRFFAPVPFLFLLKREQAGS